MYTLLIVFFKSKRRLFLDIHTSGGLVGQKKLLHIIRGFYRLGMLYGTLASSEAAIIRTWSTLPMRHIPKPEQI